MISNQILQNTLEGLKNISHAELCVLDIDGKEVASTSNDFLRCAAPAREFVESPADSQEIQGYQYFKIFDEQQLEYILIVLGGGDNVYMLGKMIAFQIQGLLVAYKERFDKDNFIKNLLLDNLLLVDIYSRAKKLHIKTDAMRVTMIVESSNGRELGGLEMVRSYIGNTSDDFASEVSEFATLEEYKNSIREKLLLPPFMAIISLYIRQNILFILPHLLNCSRPVELILSKTS